LLADLGWSRATVVPVTYDDLLRTLDDLADDVDTSVVAGYGYHGNVFAAAGDALRAWLEASQLDDATATPPPAALQEVARLLGTDSIAKLVLESIDVAPPEDDRAAERS
jgi:hypothetical protein